MSETPQDDLGIIQFETPRDRRGFLSLAGLIGAGGVLVAAGCGNNSSTGSTTSSSPSSAATSAPATAAPSPVAETNPFGMGDVGILNYALTLEYLEADFYAKGVAANILGDDQKYIAPIAAHEAAHVQALLATIAKLNGTPAKKPTFKYPDGTFTDKAKFLGVAVVFEETGVKAYHGQVPHIQDKGILGAAASIAGVESRHAAVINDILGKKQVPSPFEDHASIADTVTAVTPFLGA